MYADLCPIALIFVARIISYYITIETYMESIKLDRQLFIDAALILLGSFLLATGY